MRDDMLYRKPRITIDPEASADALRRIILGDLTLPSAPSPVLSFKHTFEVETRPGYINTEGRTRGVLRSPSFVHKGPMCAPYALASLTGMKMSEFLMVGRRGRLRGLSIAEIGTVLAMNFRDVNITSFFKGKRPMLWQVLDGRSRGIAVVTRHAVAFDGFMVDDLGSPGPKWVHDARSARKRMSALFTVGEQYDSSEWLKLASKAKA